MARNKQCRKCLYSWKHLSGNEAYCDYLGKTGKRRGCPVEGCTRFEDVAPVKKGKTAIQFGEGRKKA